MTEPEIAASERFPRRWATWSLRRRARFALAIGALLLLPVYGVSLLVRSARFYAYLKHSDRGFTDGVFAPDPELGLAPVPSAAGSELVPLLPPILARFDTEGFRATAAPPASARAESLLGLGCSWTYGAACRAEDTYVQRLADALELRGRNAGVPSYGLSQMLLRARRDVPRLKPRYVIAQYAPWLVLRSQSRFAQTEYGWVPTPYFVSGPGARALLQPPVFRGRALWLPASRYRRTESGPWDAAAFFVCVGAPMLAHDDAQMTLQLAQRRLTRTPSAAGAAAIVRAVFGELSEISKRNGARLVIAGVGIPLSAEVRSALEAAAPGALVVDTARALCAPLPEGCGRGDELLNDPAYQREYGHFAGSPPRLVDLHPNPRAHAAIAAAILEAIRGASAARVPEPPRPASGEARRP